MWPESSRTAAQTHQSVGKSLSPKDLSTQHFSCVEGCIRLPPYGHSQPLCFWKTKNSPLKYPGSVFLKAKMCNTQISLSQTLQKTRIALSLLQFNTSTTQILSNVSRTISPEQKWTLATCRTNLSSTQANSEDQVKFGLFLNNHNSLVLPL